MPLITAKLELFRGRTVVEAPANEYTEKKKVGVCGEHKGVPLWQQTWYRGIKVFNPVCPLCEIQFCREIKAEDVSAAKKQAEKLGELSKHYSNLSATMKDQSDEIAFLGEEFDRIKTKLDNHVPPSQAVNIRRVTHAVEDAMTQVKARFEEQEAAISGNRTYALDQVRALYKNIADVKKTMVAFQNKSEKAQELAREVLQSTIASLNRLAEQLDEQANKWGEDIQEVRDDLEFARAHIGSLQVDLREAKVDLSSQVKQAIRSFSKRSILLEDRMDRLEAQVASNTEDIRLLKSRVSNVERAQRDRTEIQSLQRQIDYLAKVPVVRATAVSTGAPAAADAKQREPASTPASTISAASTPASTISANSNRQQKSNLASPRGPATKSHVSSAAVTTTHEPPEAATATRHSSTEPIIAVPVYRLEDCKVRSKGRSKTTTLILEIIGKLKNCFVHSAGRAPTPDNLSDFRQNVEEVMVFLTLCSEAYALDSEAVWKNEPFEESELAVIVETTRRAEFADNEEVQADGCALLGHLARNATNQERIGNLGGLGVVTSALKQFPVDEDVQCHGCRALFRLVWNNQKHQAKAMSMEGAPPRHHHHHQEASSRDCGGDIAILECIIETMKTRFPDSDSVQNCACLALGALSQNNPPYAKQIGHHAGGVELVLDVMRRFSSPLFKDDPGVGHVMAAGCFALESMTGVCVENQETIKKLNGLDFARNAFRNLSSGSKAELEDHLLPSLNKKFLFPC